MNAARALVLIAAEAPHRGPDRIGPHLLLALAVFVFVALGWFGMWRGWRRRVRRAHPDLPPPPQPPAVGERGTPVVAPVRGLYVGTVTAGNWLDRVAADGLSARATASLQVTELGALIDRDGAGPVWLPAAALRSARVDVALAGKVMGPAGLLVIGWRHGPYELESGFRADDRDTYARLLGALRAILPAEGPDVPYRQGPAADDARAEGGPYPDGAAALAPGGAVVADRAPKGRHR